MELYLSVLIVAVIILIAGGVLHSTTEHNASHTVMFALGAVGVITSAVLYMRK